MVPSCFWFCASCFLILIPFWFFWFLIDPECWVVGLNKSDKSHSWPFGARFPMENLIESFVWSADWARQNPHTHTHIIFHTERPIIGKCICMHAYHHTFARIYMHARIDICIPASRSLKRAMHHVRLGQVIDMIWGSLMSPCSGFAVLPIRQRWLL